jgi:hypothetical protein
MGLIVSTSGPNLLEGLANEKSIGSCRDGPEPDHERCRPWIHNLRLQPYIVEGGPFP